MLARLLGQHEGALATLEGERFALPEHRDLGPAIGTLLGRRHRHCSHLEWPRQQVLSRSLDNLSEARQLLQSVRHVPSLVLGRVSVGARHTVRRRAVVGAPLTTLQFWNDHSARCSCFRCVMERQ